ncbi:MAG: transcription elongation factor GreA [Candidatus Omnitrophica bacterium]|nr:transcription elongation factor GreA [Candidatus Omnitrophota bacterium]
MEWVYLTKEGYDRLVKELEYLKNVKRKEIAKALEHARSLGDLRENAEYSAAKEALSANEKRIQELEEKLSRVQIIDDSQSKDNKIRIGSKVKLLDLDTEETIGYTLVGADEANPLEGLISITSPVGKALLTHTVGDIVEIKVPAGLLKYKILEIN